MPARKSLLRRAPERPELDQLLETARLRGGATEAELQEQRVSFAYGNAPFDSDAITKESVRRASTRIRLRA